MTAAAPSIDATSSIHRLLDGDQLAAFTREGFVVLPGWFAREEMLALLPGIEEHLRDVATRPAWSQAALGALIWHPALLAVMEQLLGPGFRFHHLHATRHDPGTPGVDWHNDYEQIPQTNRSHREVIAFIYPGGLDGTIGDLVVVPRTQDIACDWYQLSCFGTAIMPGEVVIDRLPPGSVVLAHTGLLHCRRPRPGVGERWFVDVNYCQAGIRWPAWSCGDWQAMYRTLHDRCPDARRDHLFDASAFFDATLALARQKQLVPQGSDVARLA